MGSSPAIDLLRASIRRLEMAERRPAGVLPFGVPAVDACLPGGGLALASLHEVGGDGAVAASFAAGIMARLQGQVLWCLRDADLFAPGLAAAGLHADRVIHVEAGDERTLLACFEEGLRHGGLAGVVAEVGRLPMTGSRRLQLAAESGKTLGIALRRWRRPRDAGDFGQPSAAVSRWRVSVLPSAPLPVAGIGRPRWRLELLRCRGGEAAEFAVAAADAKGRLAFAPEADERPVAVRRRA